MGALTSLKLTNIKTSTKLFRDRKKRLNLEDTHCDILIPQISILLKTYPVTVKAGQNS